MPYTGIGDDSLPKSVQNLPKRLREIWVAVFNEMFAREPADEGAAHRGAWAAVRDAQKEKERMNWDWKKTLEKAAQAMSLTLPPLSEGDAEVLEAAAIAADKDGTRAIDGVDSPRSVDGVDAEKAVKLSELEMTLQRDFTAQHPGWIIWEMFDDHVIARAAPPDGPDGAVAYWFNDELWKVPFTVQRRPLPEAPEYEAIDGATFAPREEWAQVTPVFTQFKALKQTDGRTRWVMTSSGGFEDRDGEIVSTAFLESAVKAADHTGNRGPLLIFHVPGSEIGTCDTQAVIGEPGFLVESGLFAETEAGQRAAAFFEEHAKEYGGSIKFLYVNRTPDGVYLPPGLIVERSVLPANWAAFPWSAITLKEVTEMAKGLSAEKRAELERVLGPDLTEQIVAGLADGGEALKALGVRWKEIAKAVDEVDAVDAPEGDVTGVTAAETDEADTDDAVDAADAVDAEADAEEKAIEVEGQLLIAEPMELVLSQEALEAVAEKATARLQEVIAPMAEGLETLRAALSKMAADVEQLKRTEDERVAEKVRNLPRATVKAIGTGAQPTTRPSQRTPVEDHEGALQGSLHEKGMKALYGE